MVDKLLKDINSDGGRTKIHINEIADDLGRLLGDLTGWEIGDNANGTYFKHPSGIMLCWREVQLDFETTGQENFDFPVAFTEFPLILKGIRDGTYPRYVSFIINMIVGVDEEYSGWKVTKTKTTDVGRPMVLGALGLWK
ncbi:MAG: hypothetical protein L0K24_11885 [Tetragenococcus koreensis]|nr:hypothetical protein [Tetragenococcus koreensis]